MLVARSLLLFWGRFSSASDQIQGAFVAVVELAQLPWSRMGTKIFVNLPVKDLTKSMAFFAALGWTFNLQFTDETAASMIISDDIYAMLLTHAKFTSFTNKKIADSASAEALIAISVDRKEDVNRIADAAIKAGGQEAKPPQDYGFMQLRSFLDLDGHHWEVLYMDPNYVQPQS